MALEDMSKYLQHRAQQLGLGRADDLAQVQAHLDKLYPGQCRVVSLNKGVLKITTHNASVASELRFGKVKIMAKFSYLESINIVQA